ncbi:AEC family transporter [Pseudomonas sp. Marseille-QA0892]
MLAVFNVAFPVFSLIFIGFFCRRREILGANASTELNRFVIYLALPALLFDAMARLPVDHAFDIGYIVAFLVGMACVFGVTLMVRLRQKAPFIDATIDALGAAYPNAGYMGVPLCLLMFGDASMPPVVIAMLLTACLLFAIAIVMIEMARQAEGHLGRTLLKVARALLRNPIMVAPLLGLLVSATGLTVPSGISELARFLGAAASPCALVSIGLFLASSQNDGSAPVHRGTLSLLVGLKLFVQPAVTAVLVFWVFEVPAVWAYTAVLLSALPIGTGPFMLAELYGREATTMSRAILYSTLISLVTISTLIAVIPHS